MFSVDEITDLEKRTMEEEETGMDFTMDDIVDEDDEDSDKESLPVPHIGGDFQDRVQISKDAK